MIFTRTGCRIISNCLAKILTGSVQTSHITALGNFLPHGAARSTCCGSLRLKNEICNLKKLLPVVTLADRCKWNHERPSDSELWAKETYLWHTIRTTMSPVRKMLDTCITWQDVTAIRSRLPNQKPSFHHNLRWLFMRHVFKINRFYNKLNKQGDHWLLVEGCSRVPVTSLVDG